MSLNQLTIQQAHKGLKNKDFSAGELTEAVLEQIKKRDKDIGAYLTVTEDLALEQAKKVDEKIKKREEIGVLEGIPVAVKDVILVEDVKCTAASKILENHIAPYDATVIKKFKKAGAVIVGKTNLDEFAMGSSTENSAFGITRNPHDLERVSGGSSGGSAAAAKDAKIVLEAISGKDGLDSTSVEFKNKFQVSSFKLQDLKIGLPKEYFIKGLDPEVEEVIKKAISKFEKMGAEIIEVSLPHTEYALAAYYIIMPAEVSANLARYDGIKYGLSEKGDNLLEVYLKTRQHGFGSEPQRRIMLGAYALSAGYYEAYYLKAQKMRTLIKKDFDEAFKKVDVIMTPVSPTPAFKIGEKIDDPLQMYLSDIFTVPINLAGAPAVSIPCGKVGQLPIGLQIIGKHFDEEKILDIAQAYEDFTS